MDAGSGTAEALEVTLPPVMSRTAASFVRDCSSDDVVLSMSVPPASVKGETKIKSSSRVNALSKKESELVLETKSVPEVGVYVKAGKEPGKLGDAATAMFQFDKVPVSALN